MSAESVLTGIQTLSRWSIPLMITAIPLYAHLRGVRVYETFVAGALDGALTAGRILPHLIAMWVALAVLRSSGILDLLLMGIGPILAPFGIPPEVLPLALIRPLSGSGALSMVSDLLQNHGPDSPIGQLASIIQGSTETTFYVVTVYLGAIGVTKARHGLAAGLVGDLTGFIGAVAAWHLFCQVR